MRILFEKQHNMILEKPKRGRPTKYDFSDLQPGVPFRIRDRRFRKKPWAFIAYWNRNNPTKQVEILTDQSGNLYVSRK